MATNQPVDYGQPSSVLPRAERQATGIQTAAWGRFGFLAKVSPTATLFKSIIDPLIVVIFYLALCKMHYGRVALPHFASAAVVYLLTNYILDGSGLFLPNKNTSAKDIAGLVLGWFLVVGAALGLVYAAGLWSLVNRAFLIEWAFITPLLLFVAHGLVSKFFLDADALSGKAKKAVIIGATESGKLLAQEFKSQPWMKVKSLGFFDDRPVARTGIEKNELLGGIAQLADYVRKHNVHAIYITLPMASQPRVLAILDELRDTTASIYFVPDMFIFDLIIQAELDHVGNVPVLAVCETPFLGVSGMVKRLFDIVFASAALLMLWPVLLGIAVAVKLTSRGPVIFKQKRYGLNGESIEVYKFRSMTVQENGSVVTQAKRNDSRLTKIGGFLRKTSLDELPQFINVLQGRMSVVGPRPHANAHNEQYRKLIKGYMIRHKARPGITGWAQVNGYRGETDTLDKMENRVAYDLDYLRCWSLWLDVKIIIKTITMVFNDKSAF
ncbi:undecaprenyl-phosphate glucose phosphotransferase [Aquitalea sp. LB_tupeE]|uniref:undecaprenyl-phosphate glucose phosphotransferase n=1 Tax=Aquitalea sp. LB_tupeE TaxID=2748078 RepID=UPI0015B8E177|nr:undecaprenyl-phosphate glucose phosphotransferase [Aquitalea sp. LB_tupeE]NWK79429.1 undecaprenyl-phosphate glucose phosphotransferase [Aquitalea sp. LB_tupeE]